MLLDWNGAGEEGVAHARWAVGGQEEACFGFREQANVHVFNSWREEEAHISGRSTQFVLFLCFCLDMLIESNFCDVPPLPPHGCFPLRSTKTACNHTFTLHIQV